MTTGKVVLITVLAGTISIGFAIFGQQWLQEGKGLRLRLPLSQDGAQDRLDSLPDFRLADIAGGEMSSSAWAGKVLVLNYWATWCPPCLREIPLLMEMQETRADDGLQVVGIAIDSKEDVERFLEEHLINYPILLGDMDAIEMSRRMGNRLQGLPFTVVFDRFGNRVHAQVGEVTRTSLNEQLEPLLPPSPETQTTGN
ncbi:MAG: TlpA disulfide reductase family protein [Pseudomonadota bacterium]|nr:TlpA disulfide reductase family protein [Pseudomonadota bacterium]